MKLNPLLRIQNFDQKIWLDFIRRGMLTSDELRRRIEDDGLSGVTSNPAIFDKAITGSHDYESDIETLVSKGKTPREIYEALTIEDVQRAADILRSGYDKSDGRDGFVSLEVSPHLAHDSDHTIAAARRLWEKVQRPNLLIKVPATREGLPAITRLIAEGINVNVTLLFGLPRYREVAEAYIAGLETRLRERKPLGTVASVASFFLSCIDTLVDSRLDKITKEGGPQAETARTLVGKIAIASAKMADHICKELFDGERFQKLAEHGAFPQRLLWASTSTKNPAYSDVKYVEPLIGSETINTLPLEMLEAFRDHGRASLSLEENFWEYSTGLERLPEVGIKLDEVTQQLEDEGVRKFIEPHDHLMSVLEEKCTAVVGIS